VRKILELKEDRKPKILETPFYSPDDKEEWYEFECPRCNKEMKFVKAIKD